MSRPGAPAPGARRGTWPYWLTAAAIYLALAPVGEEPHLLGKLRWVAGGAVGMEVLDWIDLGLHGVPLVGAIAYWLVRAVRRR